MVDKQKKTFSMAELQSSSYMSGANASYIEALYESFLENPELVADEWRHYFTELRAATKSNGLPIFHSNVKAYFLDRSKSQHKRLALIQSSESRIDKQANVDQLIHCYRLYGHLSAITNPLNQDRQGLDEITLNFHGLTKQDCSKNFLTHGVLPVEAAPLSDIIDGLERIYCGSIGSEYVYVGIHEEREWLQENIESRFYSNALTVDEKKTVLGQLTRAETLEHFLGMKYVGQKRFSLEGCESLIPFLDKIINQSSEHGVSSTIIGMAHRGRLNVLVNTVGQSSQELFEEFEGKKDYGMTSGDVKYHLGFASDVKLPTGDMHISLAFNPSHLEFIGPVVMGSVRARQDWRGDRSKEKVMAVIIHGDSAFAGQGVTAESLAMSATNAYHVGGTIHVVVNNQIGFTTSDVADVRSSKYCTDLAKMISAPVFHVNADDPESVYIVAKLAADYRAKFHKDIVIDLVGYRRFGHNESDEPSATQPLMYQIIKTHPSVRKLYAQKLIDEKVCNAEHAKTLIDEYKILLKAGKRVIETIPGEVGTKRAANWMPYLDKDWDTDVATKIELNHLKSLAKKITQLPEDFKLQKQVGNRMQARLAMAQGQAGCDWGFAEALAFASVLDNGSHIRICGQDSQRGTFSHRHAVLHDYERGECYTPLANISERQGRFEVYNSLLSESGALGFEYGYATADPSSLVIWEAQFGDFANGAQVIIDQFISSGWQKWQRLCGLTLFLPHGYEGMGPEHSSARLERFLQLCAQHNMQVCTPTTPAQIFHLIRRQIIRPYRRPLIVMTPKSLLGNKMVVSDLKALAEGEYELVLPELDRLTASDVKRVVICGGKVYYDLLIARRKHKHDNVAIIRIEQLYPFPYDEVKKQLKKYKNATEFIWCQEEPKNQGAWYSIQHKIRKTIGEKHKLVYVGRQASAAPAVGYPALHKQQQETLIKQAIEDKLRD